MSLDIRAACVLMSVERGHIRRQQCTLGGMGALLRLDGRQDVHQTHADTKVGTLSTISVNPDSYRTVNLERFIQRSYIATFQYPPRHKGMGFPLK